VNELRQFTSVAIGDRAVLIAGAPGVGKSSLALALIDRGAMLVGDDGVDLHVMDGRLFASPAPTTQGLIEVRGVGLMPMPTLRNVPVALLICLSHDAPRYVEEAPREAVMKVQLPAITLWPEASALALRVEMALARHGLPVQDTR
jgi:serine kinase of HPr protein (carbohydrate metabolism regulator)